MTVSVEIGVRTKDGKQSTHFAAKDLPVGDASAGQNQHSLLVFLDAIARRFGLLVAALRQ